MNPTQPITDFARAALTAAAVFLFLNLSTPIQGQTRALNFDTPTWIEVERTEVSGYEGSTTVTVNLIRTGEFRVLTKVDFQTLEGTATEGTDYKGAGGTVIFQPGEGYKSITFELLADQEIETEESFQVQLSTSSPNAFVAADSVRVLIQDAPLPISNPSLTIKSPEHGQVRVSWQGSAEVDLETSADPSTNSWLALDCVIESKSGQCQTLVSAAQALGFFRLRVR